jgi:L-threonylcarbamoyladenylate synthase
MSPAIKKALSILNKPGVILTPTETIVGLSCSALSESQIHRIYKIKNRSDSKTFIVLVDSILMIYKFVNTISDLQKEYLNASEPTTVILNNIKGLPPSLVSEDGTLAFRITKHPELKILISHLGIPLVSTSANLSGESAPKKLEDVDPVILDQIDYSLNLHSNYNISSKPSKIVMVKGNKVDIIRK